MYCGAAHGESMCRLNLRPPHSLEVMIFTMALPAKVYALVSNLIPQVLRVWRIRELYFCRYHLQNLHNWRVKRVYLVFNAEVFYMGGMDDISLRQIVRMCNCRNYNPRLVLLFTCRRPSSDVSCYHAGS